LLVSCNRYMGRFDSHVCRQVDMNDVLDRMEVLIEKELEYFVSEVLEQWLTVCLKNHSLGRIRGRYYNYCWPVYGVSAEKSGLGKK